MTLLEALWHLFVGGLCGFAAAGLIMPIAIRRRWSAFWAFAVVMLVTLIFVAIVH